MELLLTEEILQRSLTQSNTKATTLEKDNKNLQDESTKLNETVRLMDEENESLSGEKSRLEKANNTLKNQMKAAKEENEEFKESKSAMEEELSKTAKEMMSIKGEKGESNSTCLIAEQLRKTILQLERDHSEKVTELTDDSSNTKEELTRANDKLKRTQNQLAITQKLCLDQKGTSSSRIC